MTADDAEETTVVPDLPPTQAADPVAWSIDTEPLGDAPTRRRVSPAAVTAAAVIVSLVAVLVAVTVAYVRLRGATHNQRPVAAGAPAPARPLLNGVYRLDYDWAHQTYRGDHSHTAGGNVNWKHDAATSTDWWAFTSTCTDTDCVALGVMVDSQHNALPPGNAHALRWVNGMWQDLTPHRGQDTCTYADNGQAAGSAWQTMSWGFEPLPDGTFHGTYVTRVDTDECGDKGNTLLVPFTATMVGPVPAGVLTPVHLS